MKAFFDRIRTLTGPLSQAQVDGFETILAASAGLPVTHRAYLLATAWHETARTMQPVRETLAATDDKAIARLEAAFAKGKLPWVRTPYWRKDSQGRSWLGRGYVQLTHETNYRRAGRELGVDLVGNPDVAMQPTVAAQVLVRGCAEGWFTGKKLADYLPGDYIGARRVVNGTDKAAQIAAYAETFEAALVAAQAAPAPEQPAPVTPPAGPAPKPGIWAAIIAIIASIFGGKK